MLTSSRLRHTNYYLGPVVILCRKGILCYFSFHICCCTLLSVIRTPRARDQPSPPSDSARFPVVSAPVPLEILPRSPISNMLHAAIIADETGGASSSNSGLTNTAPETEPSDLNATSSATALSAPKSPSKTQAARNRKRKEKRQQAAGDPTAEKPTQAAEEDQQLVLQAPRAQATIAKSNSSTPAPPPPPDTAKVLAGRLNRLIEYTVLTVGDVLKGVLHVLTFTFVLLQKPMYVVAFLHPAVLAMAADRLTDFSFAAQWC